MKKAVTPLKKERHVIDERGTRHTLDKHLGGGGQGDGQVREDWGVQER